MDKIKLSVLSLSTLLLLAACGNGADETPETPQETDQTEQTPADDSGATDDGTTDDGAEGTTEDDTTTEDTETPAETGGQQASAGILAMDFQVSFDDAIQTFFDTFGEGINIDEIYFDFDDGAYHYDISGWDDENDYELEINAETGDIMDQSVERDNDSDDILDLANIIQPEEAMNAAIEASDTDVIEEWELGIENGRPVYDIEFQNDRDVKIDAETGDVI